MPGNNGFQVVKQRLRFGLIDLKVEPEHVSGASDVHCLPMNCNVAETIPNQSELDLSFVRAEPRISFQRPVQFAQLGRGEPTVSVHLECWGLMVIGMTPRPD